MHISENSRFAVHRFANLVLGALLAATAVGCQYDVQDGDLIEPFATTFGGEHQYSGQNIHVQALNRQTDAWETIASTTSSCCDTGFAGHYIWSAPVDFTSLANSPCYFGDPGTCQPPLGAASAQIRFVADGDLLGNVTPEDAFCYGIETGAGASPQEAVATCGIQTDKHVITIWVADSTHVGNPLP